MKNFFTNPIPCRYIISMLSCLACFLNMYFRSSFSISILAMVNDTEVIQSVSGSHECKADSQVTNNITQTKENNGKYAWDHYTQGLLLGAENYGFLFTQILGGILSERYGAKWVTGGGLLLTGLCFCLIPTAADIGIPFIFIVRLCQGIAEGVIVPSLYTLTSEWIVPSERAATMVFITVSGVLGNGIGAISSGFFSASNFMGGWPAAFYVPAIACAVWLLLWKHFVYSSPEIHPTITHEELLHILNAGNFERRFTSKKKPRLPWGSLVTSGPFWALLAIRIVHYWFVFTTLQSLPLYMDSVFGLSVAQNGLVNGILYAVALSGTIFEGFGNMVKRKSNWSTTVIRKIFCVLAYGGSAICWICIPSAGCNTTLMITLLYISKFFFTFSYVGDNVVMLDMAPQYSGTLFGISSTVGSMSGFISPTFTGYVTQQNVSITQWSIVFYTAAAIYIVGLCCFLLWGSAELQPWAKSPEDSKKDLLTSTSSASDYGSLTESTTSIAIASVNK